MEKRLENQVNSKLSVNQEEVFHNTDNANLLIKKGDDCKLDKSDVGAVPLLWTGSDCILGDQPIIDYFNQQISK